MRDPQQQAPTDGTVALEAGAVWAEVRERAPLSLEVIPGNLGAVKTKNAEGFR